MDTTDPEEPALEPGLQAEGVRARPDKFVPTARLSIEKQLEILRCFSVACKTQGDAVSNDDVAKVGGVKSSTVAMTNHFFKSLGLLEAKEGKFRTTPLVDAYQVAEGWKREDAAHKLSPAFVDSWFGKAILARLAIRPLSKAEAVKNLAEESNASPHYADQLERCIEFLETVGLVADHNGMLTANGNQTHGETPAKTPEEQPSSGKTASLEAIDPNADVLYLNKDRSRKVLLIAPHDMSAAEVKRTKKWLELLFFVDEPTDENDSQQK
jgi:hypothetical protein